MVDTKKEQERDELHRAIWAIADELRGAVDGWDFKNYVLGTMFYRYISENLCNYINSGEIDAGNEPFQAGEGAFQFFQQGGGVLQGLFALLHQDIIIKTIAELFDAAVEIGTLLQGFGQFHIWFLHFALI